jgi:signal transduction histidine kinase
MGSTTGTVLVVDDDRISCIVLCNQLEMEGYTVVAADHGRRAIELLCAKSFDLVLLDLLMPEMDGFQVLEYMKADDALRHIPVIVISALDEMGSVVRSIQMGATDHLSKPCDPFLLRARINASLAAKRLHDHDAEYRRQVAYLTKAASDLEAGSFQPQYLDPVAARADALGQLARVFQRMANEVFAREHHLQQQSQIQSALISKITHELRSPFVAAGFSLQVLQRYVERGMLDEMQAQVNILDRQMAEGRKMIDNVITFASLVGKQVETHLEATDIEALIQHITLPLRQVARARGVTLLFDMTHLPASICVDQKQIGEAIYHLVHNAIKFNREHGTARIGCQVVGKELVFVVEDTGPGIAPDKLNAIWEAFTQTSDAVQRGVEGLGLGLALVKYVAETHRGTAFARSVPGEGSVFGFRIPLP